MATKTKTKKTEKIKTTKVKKVKVDSSEKIQEAPIKRRRGRIHKSPQVPKLEQKAEEMKIIEPKPSEGKKIQIQYQFTPKEQEQWQKNLRNLIDLRKDKSHEVAKEKYYQNQFKKEEPAEEKVEKPVLSKGLADPFAEYTKALEGQKEIESTNNRSSVTEVLVLFLGIAFTLTFLLTLYNILQTGYYFDFLSWFR